MKTLLTLLCLVCVSPLAAQDTRKLEVRGGKTDLTNVPVRVHLGRSLGMGGTRARVEIFDGDRSIGMGQMIETAKEGQLDLAFVLPSLKAGERRTLTARAEGMLKSEALSWHQKEPGQKDLLLRLEGEADKRPILRYMHARFDDSSKENRDRTYKVFHHLWSPDGKRLVTNGGHTDPHTDPKKLLFPHHRGLMFAFNRITYDGGKKADTWHATGDAHQSHEKFLEEFGGPVVASHTALVNWHGEKKEVFAREERRMTVWNVPGGTLVDVDIVLKSIKGKVRLDGDPQHAGFQFRASNDLNTQGKAKLTYYLRPDGKGKPGETINWDPKSKNPRTINLPWKVLSFVLDDQRYSVAYIDHPDNPGEKRHSERDYGRFGYYFEYDLTPEQPLHLRYRVWLQKGEMTPEQVEALRSSFVHPPQAATK